MICVVRDWIRDETHLVPMDATDQAFVGADDGSDFGYLIRDSEDYVPGDGQGEFLGLTVAMYMYETNELSGATSFGWSWSVVPETPDECEHLANVCHSPSHIIY